MYWRIAGMSLPPITIANQVTIARMYATAPSKPVSLPKEELVPVAWPAALKGKAHPDAADEQQMRNRENDAKRDGQPVAIGVRRLDVDRDRIRHAPIISRAALAGSCARMRAMRIALSLAALGSLLAFGQPAPASIERGTLRLHYVQKPIGYERYEVAPDGDCPAEAPAARRRTCQADGRFRLHRSRRTRAAGRHAARQGRLHADLVPGEGQELSVRERRLRRTRRGQRRGGPRGRRRREPRDAAGAVLHGGRLRAVLGADAAASILEAARSASGVADRSRAADQRRLHRSARARGDSHRREGDHARALRHRRRRLGPGNAVARRTRIAGGGDHARRRPQLRGGA